MSETTNPLREKLESIAKAEGQFSRDPLKHAQYVIEDMQGHARAALALLDKGEVRWQLVGTDSGPDSMMWKHERVARAGAVPGDAVRRVLVIDLGEET